MHLDSSLPQPNRHVATDERGELHVAATIQPGSTFRIPVTHRPRTVLRTSA